MRFNPFVFRVLAVAFARNECTNNVHCPLWTYVVTVTIRVLKTYF